MGSLQAGIEDDRRADVEAAWAALDVERLVDLTRELVDVPSPLGSEEDVARVLAARMPSFGLRPVLQRIVPGRANAIGHLTGTGGGRTLLLNGHLDTGDTAGSAADWPGLELPADDPEWITGDGSWNMKASVAAFVAAADAIARSGVVLAGDVTVAATAGAWDKTRIDPDDPTPEGYGVGPAYLLAHGGYADAVLVGEPTGLTIVDQHFGRSHVRIDVEAVPADRAPQPPAVTELTTSTDPGPFPSSAGTILRRVTEVADAIELWAPDYASRTRIGAVPGYAVVNGIAGGRPAEPGVFTRASVFVNLLTLPGADPADAVRELRTLLGSPADDGTRTRAAVTLVAHHPGPRAELDGDFVRALTSAHVDVLGEAPRHGTVWWYSDGSQFAREGIPAINYGPRGEARPGQERLRIDELVRYTRVCIDLIVRMCREPLR